MIYTSYMGNLKNLPDVKKYSIMCFTPAWCNDYIDGVISELAPDEKCLTKFKNKEITEEEFTKSYIKKLDKLTLKKIIPKIENSVLLCTCKLGKFCHRHILSKYLREKKIKIVEIEVKNVRLNVEVTDKLTVARCNKNKDKIFVFGDNAIMKGKKGQAVIRDCGNSFGIPTKRYPSMKEGSFFTDTLKDKILIMTRLLELRNLAYNGKTIVFPEDGIGTGLSVMGYKSPHLYILMHNFIENNFLKYVD